MKRADDIRRVFQRAGLGLDPDADERIFQDVFQARRKTIQNPRTVFDRWRKIMKSPLTKVAVAAAVVVAGVIGVSLWNQTGSGLALADVLARMEQVQVYRFQMSMTLQVNGAADQPIAESTTLVSQTLGERSTLHMNHPLTGESMSQETFVLLPQRTMTMLMPQEKKYAVVELDDATIEAWQAQNDPRRIVEQVLKYEHTSLGRSVVDGVEVEGFQATDASLMGGSPLAGAEIKIWAAVETKLPVRLEIDKSAPGMGHVHAAAHDFEWDVSAAAAEFSAVIPDDYTPGRPLMQAMPKK
jgi:outer membrane lipoprotein-sorting protein